MTMLAAALFAATFTRTMERVSTVDPAFETTVYDSHAVQLIYETPLEIDYVVRPYRVSPGFCDLPRVSADGLTYVFPVRSRSLGAADMVRSLERLRAPSIVSPNGWIVKDIDTIEATDERTVTIRLKRRCHFFPWLMTLGATAIRGEHGEGSGPYRLTTWRKNHEMVFTRREPAPKGFDVVRYLVVDDASTQWLMFLKGELDFLGEVSRDNWDTIFGADGKLDPELARQGVTLASIPTLEVMHIGINMRDAVLGPNRKLRQALNAAFDYPAWERFYQGRISPGAIVPPEVEGSLAEPMPYAFNLAKARELIAEAGYPNGIDARTNRRLTLTMSIGKANQESREAGELIAAFYEKIGIRLELAFMTWDAFLKAVNEGRVQLFRMGWVGDYPDAQNFLQLFSSKNVSPGPNHANYANPAFDAAFDAALNAADAAGRNRQWAICQRIVREDCPWVFTHVNKAHSLVRATVKNYRATDFPYGVEKYYENALH